MGMRRGVFMWIMWVLVLFDYFNSPWATSSDPFFAQVEWQLFPKPAVRTPALGKC